MKQTIKYQQSKNWWEVQDIDWMINNAQFAFTHIGHRGNRVRIVTNVKLNGMNCFEFCNDKYGIRIVSASLFSGLENYFFTTKVKDKKGIIDMLNKFLIEWGAGEFINPKRNIKYYINKYRKNFKIVEVTIENQHS